MNAKTEHPESDWRYEVGNGDTKLGYDEWCEHKREAVRDEAVRTLVTETVGRASLALGVYKALLNETETFGGKKVYFVVEEHPCGVDYGVDIGVAS